MIEVALREAFTFDPPFVETRRTGPSDETLRALNCAWDRLEFESRAKLGRPAQDWGEFMGTLEKLRTGRPVGGTPEYWADVAHASQDVAAQDAIAGCVLASYAMVVWEGALGPREDWPLDLGHLSPMRLAGWSLFPARLGRALLNAGAVWGARRLATETTGALEASRGYAWSEQLRAAAAELRQIALIAQRRLDDAVTRLAWDLHLACRLEPPNFAAEVAALLWTQGDVPRAHLLGAGVIPDRQVVRRLVEHSLAAVADDPFLRWVWMEMKDREPFSLRDHPLPFGPLNNMADTRELAMRELLTPVPLSASYARAAIAYFKGAVDEEHRRNLRFVHEIWTDTLEVEAPDLLLRLRALMILIFEPSELGSGTESRSDHWRELADAAAQTIRWWRRESRPSAEDRSLDIPFYYLENDEHEAVVDKVERLERYRWGGRWYWDRVIPPAAPPGSAGETLLQREKELLLAVRSTRFLRLVPSLPPSYQRFRLDSDDPLPEPRDPISVAMDARDLDERLDALWQEMEPVMPEYAARRRSQGVGVEEFARILGPGWGP